MNALWFGRKSNEKFRIMIYTDFDTRRLITDVSVCNPATDMVAKCRGLWDTGGRLSTVSQALVDRLDLYSDPEMKIRVHTSAGVHLSNVYPIKLLFEDVEVDCSVMVCGHIIDNVDIIIGMDVITKGDLSITNVNGKTEMIFRLPTSGHIAK